MAARTLLVLACAFAAAHAATAPILAWSSSKYVAGLLVVFFFYLCWLTKRALRERTPLVTPAGQVVPLSSVAAALASAAAGPMVILDTAVRSRWGLWWGHCGIIFSGQKPTMCYACPGPQPEPLAAVIGQGRDGRCQGVACRAVCFV